MTNLLYLEDFSKLNCEAHVIDITEENGLTIIKLDQTIFYPQGGGQPYDQGVIESGLNLFKVQEVRMVDNLVKHIGIFEKGKFNMGDEVRCKVDIIRRELNNRIHSAGHIIDATLEHMGINWVPGRGYHFPESPFVEYAGNLEGIDVVDIQKKLEEECNQMINKALETKIVFMNQDEMRTKFKFEPKALPDGQLARIIYFGDFGIPCGGTHVISTDIIGNMIIKKIKQHKDIIRIAYDVAR
ncbi:MAG: alanine--tRNA ligase-related protein [bacterium]|nr:alanine--tRNA ligase-related protein [bacterium]